ncbi:MAG: 2OG-Fe(II) oxygenase [Cyanobacteria bacterium P01_F01_bin.4]
MTTSMGVNIRHKYESGQQVNNDPLIYVFEDFINAIEINELINAAEANLQQALVSTDKSGVVSKGRTGQNCWVGHHQTSVLSQLSNRISKLINIPLDNAESFQLIHYHETQKYSAHYDAWEANTERGQRCMARGGQRLVTCLLYLNTVEEGGGTCFPKLDMEIRAVRGRMVVFHNCFAGTNQRHPASLHGGLPVIRGEKWACNLWFREKSRQIIKRQPKSKSKDTSKQKGFKRVI